MGRTNTGEGWLPARYVQVRALSPASVLATPSASSALPVQGLQEGLMPEKVQPNDVELQMLQAPPPPEPVGAPPHHATPHSPPPSPPPRHTTPRHATPRHATLPGDGGGVPALETLTHP